MQANYKEKIPQSETEIALGNLYELNKQIMMQTPALETNEINTAISHLEDWFKDKPTERYYMLLCHERRDYTLFNLDKTAQWKTIPLENIKDAAVDVMECLMNRGEVMSVELESTGAFEFWVRDNECYAYYLFPYSAAVLEY